MFCKNCGAKCPDDAKFCAQCGYHFTASVQAQNNISSQDYSNATPATFNPGVDYETISLSVDPDNEQFTIELYQLFGWELCSTQTIDKTNVEVVSHMDGDKLLISDTNYVKLAFRRNKHIPRYEDLVKIQNKYNENDFHESPDSSIMYIVIGIIVMLICMCIPVLLIQLIVSNLCLAAMIYIGVSKNKHNKEVQKRNEERDEICKACIGLARDIRGI